MTASLGGYAAPTPVGTKDPNDMSLPFYGVGFGTAVKRFFKGYTKFKGRASRSEYWFAYLFVSLVGVVFGILVGIAGGTVAASSNANTQAAADAASLSVSSVATRAADGGPVAFLAIVGIIGGLVGLALILPFLAIAWRRMHDANMAGAMYLLILVPSVGSIIVIVLACMPSKVEGMRFDEGAQLGYGAAPVGYPGTPGTPGSNPGA